MRRRGWFAIVLLSMVCYVGAQQKPPVVPLVTVVKTDGTSIRGSVTTVDPDQLTITPAPKPGKAAATQTIEPVTILWSEIKSVSNGLNRAKALAAWKDTNGGKLCETCHGERALYCPTCKGTAHDPASAKDCKTCKGELLVDCKAPKCKDGKVPCPKPCVKLSEGKWYMRDGKKVRDFPMPNGGTMWVSDGHLGQLFDKKTGSLGEICSTCGGTTIADCSTCHGFAKVPCATCTARKDAPACPDKCESGRVACDKCKGTGLKA